MIGKAIQFECLMMLAVGLGCASMQRSLPQDVVEATDSITLVYAIEQDGLEARVSKRNLSGSLLAAGKQSHSAMELDSLLQHTSHRDLREELGAAFGSELSNSRWPSTYDIILSSQEQHKRHRHQVVRNGTQDLTLFLITQYYMDTSSGFSFMMLTKAQAYDSDEDCVYRAKYHYRSQVYPTYFAPWVANDGALIHEVIDEAIQETTAMFRRDFLLRPVEPRNKPVNLLFYVNSDPVLVIDGLMSKSIVTSGVERVAGYIVSENPMRVHVRDARGSLFSWPRDSAFPMPPPEQDEEF